MGNAIIKFPRGDRNLSVAADEPQPPTLDPVLLCCAYQRHPSLVEDLLEFHHNCKVPDKLRVSSKTRRFQELYEEWNKSKPETKVGQAALVIRTLKRHQKEIESILDFYGLPSPSKFPLLVVLKLDTLPVDVRDVEDGDGFSVYVDTADPRESASVPLEIHEAAIAISGARAAKNDSQAEALRKKIINAGYRVIEGPNNEEILAKKYRIRLRGIDAPELQMSYGKKAKDELVKLIKRKSLKVDAYYQDKYDRWVGDVYCNGVFVQEQLLKRGCAWHYVAYEQRPAFSDWEKEARNKRRGLWALPKPEEPWEWKKKKNSARRA